MLLLVGTGVLLAAEFAAHCGLVGLDYGLNATGDLHSEVLRWCARLEPGGDYSRSLEKFEHRSLLDDANMPTKTRSLRNSQYSPP